MLLYRETGIDGTAAYTSPSILLNGNKSEFELSLNPKASLDGAPTITLQISPLSDPSVDADWIDLDVVTAKSVDVSKFQMWYGSQLPGHNVRIKYAPGGATVGTVDVYLGVKK